MERRVLALCAILVISSVACGAAQKLTKEFISQASEKLNEEEKNMIRQITTRLEQSKKQADPVMVYQEFDNMILENNSKKYGLKKNIAQIPNVPFSVPLIREMFIAADQKNKGKLRNLLNDYFTIEFGSDWKKLLTIFEDIEHYGKQRRLVLKLQPTIMQGLIKLYFDLGHDLKAPERVFTEMDRLLQELFPEAM